MYPGVPSGLASARERPSYGDALSHWHAGQLPSLGMKGSSPAGMRRRGGHAVASLPRRCAMLMRSTSTLAELDVFRVLASALLA